MLTESLTPVQRLNLGEEIAAQLREAIISAELPPGTSLGEPALAKQFGVSRAPVREALVQLEREGLVSFDTRGRTRILELTSNLFEDLVAVRVAIEGAAARLAASRSEPTLATALTRNVDQQATATTYRELTKLDVAFHETIVRASGNERLVAAWLTSRSVFEFWLAAAFREADLAIKLREAAVKSHRKLQAAILSGDGERAEKAAIEHISRWRAHIPAAARTPKQVTAE